MKKVENIKADELRSEYKRSDFGELKRGKYAARIKEESNVVVLDPDVAAAFPNDKTVNEALRGLLKIMQTTRRHVTQPNLHSAPDNLLPPAET